MKIILNGKEMEFEKGTLPIDMAKAADPELYKSCFSASVDGQLVGLYHPVEQDAKVDIWTFADDGGRKTLRHSASHVMAQAIKRLFPDTKLAIGPAIENGFYYDVDSSHVFTEEDFPAIEKEMAKIAKENHRIERFELPRDEALALVKEMNETYKVELIEDLPEDARISFYKQGEFVDLCAGPHVGSTGKIKHFKLMSVAGAYWRGDEKNKMLQRIYATVFPTKDELKAYLERLEEAKKRDHRKLGRELDLFAIMEEGPGFPFFFPKGMVIRNELENYWRQLHRERGYEEIKTPMILNEELWHRSGHWDHYKNNMYFTKIDGEDYAIKPMNCPGGMLAYRRRLWSYKDLPLRVGELGLVHRHELSGALHGLMRVRCFTQDDAHIFMTEEQIPSEIAEVMDLIDSVYKIFGFKYHVELSTCPENFIGTEEMRVTSENALKAALEAKGVPYILNPGDGAFYGPKIDFHLEDSIGRTWQCGTVQLDYQMPERFDLTYAGPDGEKHRPIMIHRVAFGSIERFIGILTEHFAGAFPTWLAPVQAKILPITDRTHDVAKQIAGVMAAEGIRVEMDDRSEKIGYKIRQAQMEKVPYMLIIGDKEAEDGTISVRSRKDGDIGTMTLENFLAKIQEEIDTKAYD
ncbi:MAG: threonine--tRNA ligase [Christensenellales bacterium]|jgi:threonyl-tRNA synthetase